MKTNKSQITLPWATFLLLEMGYLAYSTTWELITLFKHTYNSFFTCANAWLIHNAI